LEISRPFNITGPPYWEPWNEILHLIEPKIKINKRHNRTDRTFHDR
jgi:hypothetical protein